jgi:photosystem II stability/assembly factor-like uncharacterized protein
MKHALLFLFLLATPTFAQWQQQTINTTADFRGLCAVSDQIAWVSGSKGTVGRTTDGGKTWQVLSVTDTKKLDFRDIEAFSDATAYVLSIGPGDNSRIYKTTDGGKSWKLQFKNPNPDAFFDSIAFWDENHGIALSDPVQGYYHLIITEDGGTTWKPISMSIPALPSEGAFAASGTCLITQGNNDVWFVTGGAKVARVFHSTNRGQTWAVSDTPILAGKDSAGIFSIAFRDKNTGIIVGGDYRKPNDSNSTAAITSDAGRTWKLLDTQLPFRSGVSWSGNQLITVGTSGSNLSLDSGITWKSLDQQNYNTVSTTQTGTTTWAAGPKGRIAKFIK